MCIRDRSGSRFCYEVMTETPGAGATDLYATCVVNYNESEISDCWNYLYNKRLSTSMFEEMCIRDRGKIKMVL